MSDYEEGGGFIVRCPRCKGVLYKYILGDRDSKDKYIGPPILKAIYARYDVKDTCPFCGAKLSSIPRVKVLTLEQFRSFYASVTLGGREVLVERDLLTGGGHQVPQAATLVDEAETPEF